MGPEEEDIMGFQNFERGDEKARTERKRETIDMNFRREQEKKLEMRRWIPFPWSASCGSRWVWGRE